MYRNTQTSKTILKFYIAKGAFSCIINGLNSAIFHLKICNYCQTPASQAAVNWVRPKSGWWGNAYQHPLWSATALANYYSARSSVAALHLPSANCQCCCSFLFGKVFVTFMSTPVCVRVAHSIFSLNKLRHRVLLCLRSNFFRHLVVQCPWDKLRIIFTTTSSQGYFGPPRKSVNCITLCQYSSMLQNFT